MKRGAGFPRSGARETPISAGAALTGGFQWAIWMCGLAGLAAIPVAFLLIRGRNRKAGEPATSLGSREGETAGARVAVG